MMLTERLFVAHGGGIDEEFNCENDVDICIGALSKAAGCHERFSFAYGNPWYKSHWESLVQVTLFP